MNAPARIYDRAPHAASEAIAEGFGLDLYAARIDPSEPDECFRYLADLYPHRLREIIANEARAIYECGQLLIEAEISRIAQDN